MLVVDLICFACNTPESTFHTLFYFLGKKHVLKLAMCVDGKSKGMGMLYSSPLLHTCMVLGHFYPLNQTTG